MNVQKEGITVIGPPGSGKSALVKRLRILGWEIHDHDDDGLENSETGLGKGGIAEYIARWKDRAFLAFEGKFTMVNYGTASEKKKFSLKKLIFSASGSLPKSPEAMNYIRERTFVILLHAKKEDVIKNIIARPDGGTRIVGTNLGPNGEPPMSASIEEEIDKRDESYQASADAVFIITQTDTIEERAEEFEKFILQVIENSTLHSA